MIAAVSYYPRHNARSCASSTDADDVVIVYGYDTPEVTADNFAEVAEQLRQIVADLDELVDLNEPPPKPAAAPGDRHTSRRLLRQHEQPTRRPFVTHGRVGKGAG